MHFGRRLIKRPCLRTLAVISLALLLVACEAHGPGSSTLPDPSESVAAVATGAPCPAALIEGEFVANDAWGLALLDADGLTRQVIWPDGYTVSQRPPSVALLDGSGTAVAWAGDRVQIGGGETVPDHAWIACGGITVIAGPSTTGEPSVSPNPSIPSATAEPSASAAVAGPAVECGRIGPAACETAMALARKAARPDDMSRASRVVVDDLCAPTVMCDRKYPFDSLVVFVTAGANTTGWYAYEATGLKDDMPTKARFWTGYVPDHIVELLTASQP